MAASIKILIDNKANKAFSSLYQYFNANKGSGIQNPYPEVTKGGEIRGYFRVESYDWTVFRVYVKNNQLIFSSRLHVQHEGQCITYLENKTV